MAKNDQLTSSYWQPKFGFLLPGKSPAALSVSALLLLGVLSPVRATPLSAEDVGDPLDSECSSPLTELIHSLTGDDASRFYPYQESFGILPFNLTGFLPQLPAMSSRPETGTTTSGGASTTCPWIYETDYDPDRYPSVIPFAVCRCRGCLDRAADEAEDMECRLVRYRMQVLRRNGCLGGFFRYDFKLLSVPVACACMRLSSTSSQSRPPGIIGK